MIASRDKDYIRPIILFQAQREGEEVTFDVLKNYIVDINGIDESKIAIATGEQRELDGINLFDPRCPIEYVITVEALKEGWDCSFAYIFCSIANINSSIAAEQLLGRVMRMPYAKRRDANELNCAYAHLSSVDFMQTAFDLRDKMVSMGFDEVEAASNIEIERREEDQLPLEGGLFGQVEKPKPELFETTTTAPDLSGLSEDDRRAVYVHKTDDNEYRVTIKGHASEEAYSSIAKVLPESRRAGFETKIKTHRLEVEKLSPAARRIPFAIPRLMAEVDGELDFADHEVFNENHEWSLLDHPCNFESDSFSINEKSETYELDLNGNKIEIALGGSNERLALDADVENWTVNKLAFALDRKIDDTWFGQSIRMEWCRQHIEYLVENKSVPISMLWRAKFVLSRQLNDKIKRLKKLEASKAYQQFLMAPEAKPDISFDDPFIFKDGMYDGQKAYKGSVRFRKHYLDIVPDIDGAERGEELQCAMVIDQLGEIKHWLRNVVKHEASFRLPVAGGWTYPDFVIELNDGRILVVEYKGAHILDQAETKEKRMIGELWEKYMRGKGLYIMAVKDDNGKGVFDQLQAKINA